MGNKDNQKKSSEIADVKRSTVYIIQPGTPVYIKTADVCALTGKSNQWIGQLVSQGSLVRKRTQYGQMFELSDTMNRYISMIEGRAAAKEDDDAQAELEKKQADAAYKKAKAKIALLEAEEREGNMHRSEDVAFITNELIYAIRGALNALPGRLAVIVSEANTPNECSEIIQNEVYKIMEELSLFEYDPKKYEDLVRERLKKELMYDEDDE